MIADPELQCTYEGHQGGRINGVCINKDCNKLRPYCNYCIREFHNAHVNDLQCFNELEEQRQGALNFITELNSSIEELELITNVLKELIQMSQITKNFNYSSSTTVQIDQEVKQIIKIKSYGSILSKDLQQLIIQIKQIENIHQLLKSQLKAGGQIEVFQLQQQIQVKETPISSNQVNQLTETVQQQQFKFSGQDKSPVGKVLKQGMRTRGLGFFVCHPAIPNKGKTSITFKIISDASKIYIGVCQKEKLKQCKYKPDGDRKIGNGTYLINNYGYFNSHLEPEKDNKKLLFSFSKNDTIQVEVDFENKNITWIKNESQFTMQFKLQGEINYTVGSECFGQMVDILN